MTKDQEFNTYIHQPRSMWEWNFGETVDKGIFYFTTGIAICALPFALFVIWTLSQQYGN